MAISRSSSDYYYDAVTDRYYPINQYPIFDIEYEKQMMQQKMRARQQGYDKNYMSIQNPATPLKETTNTLLLIGD